MINKTSAKTAPKPLSFHFGNLLITLSILTFFLVFYPVISIYLFPPAIKNENDLRGNYITVPKIHAQAPLFLNVDPFNESAYREILKKGVAHAKGTALPGQRGSIFIFAHSSGNPLEITNYNTVFLRLGELKIGDDVLVRYNNKTTKYKVAQTKIVWPTEVKYLNEKGNQLILQTCWPIGTSLKRLLVFAAPE